LEYSKDIGFLTGEESKEMLIAHYTGVMIIGEPFRVPKGELYDFGTQGLT
jgi:aarF domain-containing kinase